MACSCEISVYKLFNIQRDQVGISSDFECLYYVNEIRGVLKVRFDFVHVWLQETINKVGGCVRRAISA